MTKRFELTEYELSRMVAICLSEGTAGRVDIGFLRLIIKRLGPSLHAREKDALRIQLHFWVSWGSLPDGQRRAWARTLAELEGLPDPYEISG